MKTIIIILLLLTTLKVVSSCYNYRETIEQQKKQRAVRIDRPERCAIYYNDGTDRWIDCMGVGYE